MHHVTANGEHYFFPVLILTIEAKFYKYFTCTYVVTVQTRRRTDSVYHRRNETLSFPSGRTTEKNEWERVYHLHIHKSPITLYKHFSQTSALLPTVPIKRENIFQVKKVRLVSEIICLY